MAIDITSSINVLKCTLFTQEKLDYMDKKYGIQCTADKKKIRLVRKRLASIYVWLLESGCDLEDKTLARIQDFIDTIEYEVFECCVTSSTTSCFDPVTISCSNIVLTEIPSTGCTNNLTLTVLI